MDTDLARERVSVRSFMTVKGGVRAQGRWHFVPLFRIKLFRI